MATYTVKSLDQMTDIVILKIESILNKVADKVKARVDQELETYYAEYNPEIMYGMKTFYYDRTNQLRDCCKIKPIKKSGNNISIEIYLDIESLNYSTVGADPYKTVMAANSGLHGGWIVHHGVATEQVPYSELGEGSNYGDVGGARIWANPMEEMFKGGKLREMFIKYAKESGLNLIAK